MNLRFVLVLLSLLCFTNQSLAQSDYYEVLGVDRRASREEIARAYRKIAIESHPDRNPGDAEALARFKAAAEAFEVLNDQETRERYDRFGSTGGSSSGMNWRDVYNPVSSYTSTSEGLMHALQQSAKVLQGEELTAFALSYLRSKIKLAAGGNERFYNYSANALADVWSRVGFWQDYNGGDLRISKAACLASFYFLADIYAYRPETAEYYKKWGLDYLGGSANGATGEYGRVVDEILRKARAFDLRKPVVTRSFSCESLNSYLATQALPYTSQ